MNCSICETPYPELELKQVCVSGERTLHVCEDCICDAIADYLDNIEQSKRNWCHGCAQFVGNICQAGLTPDRCC